MIDLDAPPVSTLLAELAKLHEQSDAAKAVIHATNKNSAVLEKQVMELLDQAVAELLAGTGFTARITLYPPVAGIKKASL